MSSQNNVVEKFIHYNEELIRICEDTQNSLTSNRNKRSSWLDKTNDWKKKWLGIDSHSAVK